MSKQSFCTCFEGNHKFYFVFLSMGEKFARQFVVYFDQQTLANACIYVVENNKKCWTLIIKYFFHYALERLM